MAQHFDVVVIGTQPAAVVAAALFAKRRRRVLLVDHGENSTTYSRNGYQLPLVPTLMPQIDSSPPLQRVHDELGLGPELRAATQVLHPAFQVLLPGHRFDVPVHTEGLLAELHLEFPGYTSAITAFVNRVFATDEQLATILRTTLPVTPRTLSERWQARSWQRDAAAFARPFIISEWLPNVPVDHPLVQTLIAPLAFFGHLAPESPSVFHAVRLLARFLRGAVVFTDRLHGLSSFLLTAARRAGVEVREATAVTEIHVDGRRLRRIEVSGEKQPLSGDYFVAGTVEPFVELLPSGPQQAQFSVEDQVVRSTGTLLVLNLIVRHDVIPCGMGQIAMVHNGRRRSRDGLPPDPPLLLQRFNASCPAKSSDAVGREVLSIACPVKTADFAHSPDRLAAMKAQMLERVARVIPFLSQHLESASLTADTGSWDLQAEGTRRIDPWRLHPLYDTNKPPLLGITARSPRTYFKNLWHCSHDVVPGLGIEGDYITALATVHGIVQDAGGKWSRRL